MPSSTTRNKKHSSKQVASITYTLEKNFFAAATFESLWVVSIRTDRSSHPEVFLGKSVLEICSKFTGKPCLSAISCYKQFKCYNVSLRFRSSCKSILHVKVEIQNLVLILYMVCKLYSGHLAIMITSLINSFVSPTYLTKFEVNSSCRIWDTKSGSHFVSGQYIYPGHASSMMTSFM